MLSQRPTAEDILVQASDAMSAASSFSFVMSHPSGTTSLPGGLFLTRADGAVVSPDRLVVNAEANYGRVFVNVSGIVIGEKAYMTNFLTGAWSRVAPEDSPFAFLDPVSLVSDLITKVEAPRFGGDAGVAGATVITGTMPAKPFEALVGTVDETRTVAVRLTFDAETLLLKQVLIEGALQVEDGPRASRLVEFSMYGENIAIEPPV